MRYWVLMLIFGLAACGDRYGDLIVVELHDTTPEQNELDTVTREEIRVTAKCDVVDLDVTIKTWEPEGHGQYLLSIEPIGPQNCSLYVNGKGALVSEIAEAGPYPMP